MTSLTDLYKIYQQHPKVITDSRKIESGCMFFALKGPHFNGNKYAEEAIQKGAAYAIVDEVKYVINSSCLLVEDVLLTLQNLAQYHRKQLTMPLLAITGSNGKTTTKELLNAVLSSHFKTHCTKGNLNNHIGVPLTLLEMPLDTEFAIIEMGANHKNEIDFLCKIALPTHGLITNIGKAHLEGFGGVEGVKQGKSELYRHLQSTGGMVFVNKDEQFLTALAAKNEYQLLYEQKNEAAQLNEVALIASHPLVKAAFLDKESGTLVQVNSHLMGTYNFSNIMTAIVTGRYFKVAASKIKEAIENYIPTNNRSQIITEGTNTYLLDAYNANPDSMSKALAYFSRMPVEKRIVILGDMLELGTFSEEEHEKMVNLALEKNFSAIWLVGTAFSKTPQKAEAIRRFSNVDDLKNWYAKHNVDNAHFLLKGSRGLKLESFLKIT